MRNKFSASTVGLSYLSSSNTGYPFGSTKAEVIHDLTPYGGNRKSFTVSRKKRKNKTSPHETMFTETKICFEARLKLIGTDSVTCTGNDLD